MDDGQAQYRMTWPMERVQAELGRPLRDELVERYQGQGQTFDEIGQALGVSATTVHRWMRNLSIEARFPGQRKGSAA